MPGIEFGIAMPGNVVGTTEQLVSSFFEIKTVTKEKMTFGSKFEKKKIESLLRARASIHIKLAYYSFQNFEYDYIMIRAKIARKVWLHVGLEFMIIFHNVFILIMFPNIIFNKVTLNCVRYLSLMRHVPAT